MITIDEQIKAALKDGLSINKSGINSDLVYKRLEKVNRKRYNKI
jgi:hypothetical protein